MINHLRTLLLNIDGGATVTAGYPGEEFVEPTYRPVTLPSTLALVRQVLFGLVPDRAMLNYRLRQLMAFIHATELAEYALAPDPRVTYWPARDSTLFDDLVAQFSVRQTAGVAFQTAYIVGGPLLGVSRLYYSWRVTITDGTSGTIDTLTSPTATTSFTYVDEGGASNPIPLPGTNLRLIFSTGTPAQYVVNVLVSPAHDLFTLAESVDGIMTSEVRQALFGASPVEPYLTFSNLWDKQRQLPYRLGGLVLALAYRMEALRN